MADFDDGSDRRCALQRQTEEGERERGGRREREKRRQRRNKSFFLLPSPLYPFVLMTSLPPFPPSLPFPPLPTFSYYHGRISRDEAVDRLQRDGVDGSFLLRMSTSQDGVYTLSVMYVLDDVITVRGGVADDVTHREKTSQESFFSSSLLFSSLLYFSLWSSSDDVITVLKCGYGCG
jgi:hypothetical protein